MRSFVILLCCFVWACNPKRSQSNNIPNKRIKAGSLPSTPNGNVGDNSPANGGIGTQDSSRANTQSSLYFEKESMRDALAFTHAVHPVALRNVDPKSQIALQRYVFAKQHVKFDPDQAAQLNRLCQDMGLSVSAEDFDLPAEMNQGSFYLHWRSHYADDIRATLGELMAAGNAVLCVLRVRVQSKGQTEYLWAVFDPLPAEGAYLGSRDAAKAKAEGVMLLDGRGQTLPLDGQHLMSVDGDAKILLEVPALNAEDITVRLRQREDTAPCYYAGTSSMYRVGDPMAMQYHEFELAAAKEYKFLGFETAAVGGKLNAHCKDVKLDLNEGIYKMSFSCGTYDKIKSEGLEAGCVWKLRFQNPLDQSNSIALSLPMRTVEFKPIDVENFAEVIKVLPKDARNPVRNGKTEFIGFSPQRLAVVEQAFDFWLAADPSVFSTNFENYVDKMSYQPNQPVLCGTSGAYVDKIGGTSINLCPHGGMQEEDLRNSATNPYLPMFRAILLAHETRHTRGFKHDWEVPNYPPCDGTALSARIAYNVATQCESDYCKVMRDSAEFNYIYELNYSLKGDARRFQGQCKGWNDGLGFTDADFAR